MEWLEKIAEEAYQDEIQKLSGVYSESLGGTASSFIPYVGPAADAVGAIAAAVTKTKTKKEMLEQQGKKASNFIPGVGSYRLYKRLGYSQKSLNEKLKKHASLEKESGVVSEIIGQSTTGAIGAPIGAIAALATKTKTDKQMLEQQKKTGTNFLPGVGTYRYLKRLGHSNKELENELHKKAELAFNNEIEKIAKMPIKEMLSAAKSKITPIAQKVKEVAIGINAKHPKTVAFAGGAAAMAALPNRKKKD